MNKQEIQQKYLELHNALGTPKDAKDKEAFDTVHRKIWADCDVELKARKTELEARGLDSVELRELREMYPEPPPPSRNLIKEIDELKVEIAKLKEKR